MQFMKSLVLVAMLGASSLAMANQDDPAAHLQAVQELMKAMQTEKMMRSITGQSGFPVEAQRKATFAKLDKMAPADIHQRLARASRQFVSQSTAIEMTRYYSSAYGKQVLHQTYNSGAGLMAPRAPTQSSSERKQFSQPAFLKAKKEFDKAEPMIQHEGFRLMQAISKS